MVLIGFNLFADALEKIINFINNDTKIENENHIDYFSIF